MAGRKEIKINRQKNPKTNSKDKNKQTATTTIKNKQMNRETKPQTDGKSRTKQKQKTKKPNNNLVID